MFKSKKVNILIVALLVSVFVVTVSLGYSASKEVDSDNETVKEPASTEEETKPISNAELTVGMIAPEFTLPNFKSDEDISLKDYEGKKVVLNFFASWCPFCQKEAPDLERINLEYGDDVQVITINLTTSEERPEDIDAYLAHYNVTSPVALDFAGEVAALYQIASTPTNYFINSDGTISDIVPGAIDYEVIKEKVEQLK